MKKTLASMMLALTARSATNPVLIPGNVSCQCPLIGSCAGNFILYSYNLPDVGYHLSKFQYYGNTANKQIYGISLTFTPDAGGADVVSSLLGETTGANTASLFTQLITNQVVAVKTYGDYAGAGDTGVETMQLMYKDGTSLIIGSSTLTAAPITTMTLCGNLIGMKCSFHSSLGGTIDKEAGCSLYDDQQLNGYSFTQTVADFTYTLNLGTTAQKTWQTTNLNLSCYGEGFTATYTKNGSAIAAPAFITFVSTAVSTYLTVTSISQADVGVYVVTIIGTLNAINNPGTGLPWTTSFSFTLTVIHECTLTTITDRVINPMSNSVSLSATTQDVTFADSKATLRANPTYCGARTFTFSPNLSFLTISGATMSLATSNLADVSTQTVNLIISLADYPLVPSIMKSFTVTITCLVQTLTFLIAPAASTTLTIGLDVQPMDILFTALKTPACAQTVTFSISPTSPFLSFVGLTHTSGTLRINGATTADLATFAKVLTATVDAKSATANFSVIISLCAVTSLTITSQAVNALYTLNQGQFMSAAFTVLQAAACNEPFTYTQTFLKNSISIAKPSWISFDSVATKQMTITINAPADVGVYIINSTATIPQNASGTNTVLSTNSSFTLTVQSDCMLTSISDKTISNMSQEVSASAATQDISFFDSISTSHAVPAYCGARTYTLTPTYTFLTISGTIMSLATSSAGDIGYYNLNLKVELTDYPTIPFIMKTFNAEIVNPCLATGLNSFFLNLMIFRLGDKTSSDQSFNQVTDNKSEQLKLPQFCGERKYELPEEYSFLSLFQPIDPWTQKFKLQLRTDQTSSIGSYAAHLKVSLKDYPAILAVEIPFKVDILPKLEVKMLPYFNTSFESATILITETQKSWSMLLPEILSPNPAVIAKQFTLKANFGDAASFVKLKGMGSIEIDDISQHNGSNIRPGMFQIFFTLDDSKTQTTVLFSLFVIEPSKFKIEIPQLPEPEQIEQQEQLDDLSLLDSLIDLLKRMIGFNKTQMKFSQKPPSPFYSQISHTGNVTIGFDSEIYVFPNISVYNNSTVYLSDLQPKRKLGSQRNLGAAEKPVPVLTVEVLPGLESDVADLKYKWNVTQANKTSLNIQLYFDTPRRVSGNPTPDQLKVTFYDTRLFMGYNGMLMDKNRTEILHYLPPQHYREGFDLFVANALDAVGSIAKSAVVSNFALNLILSASISELLGMIQAQQIMLIMSLFSLAIPTNVQIFVRFVNQITAFEIIDTQPYLNKMLNLKETGPFNSNFDMAGYQSLYFLNNLGTMVIAFLLYIVCLLLLSCINPYTEKSERLELISHKLKKSLLYESIIATMLQSYLQISICCLIGLSVISFKTYGGGVQTVANFFFFGLLFAFPVMIMIVLCRGWDQEHPLTLMKKNLFDAFFSEFRISKGPIILISPMWFMIRRFILAVCVVKLGNFLWLQVMIQSYSVIASVILIGYTKDYYRERSKFQLAFLDEVMTMLLMYCFICFTPFVPDYEARFNLGYFCLIIWVGNFAYHLSLITRVSFSNLILKGKIWWYRKAMHRERNILFQVRQFLKPIYQKRWALKPDQADETYKAPDTEESSSEDSEESSSEDSDDLEDIKAAVKAVKKYINKQKQVKLKTILKPIEEEDEESSNEEDDKSSSVQDSSVLSSSLGENWMEESKREYAEQASSEEYDPKKIRANYLWKKQQKQLYNQMRSQFPQTNPMQIPNLIQEIRPKSAKRKYENPKEKVSVQENQSCNQRIKQNKVEHDQQKEVLNVWHRGSILKKKDKLLEKTLKYFEKKHGSHLCRDPDIERLPNSEHSNRQVICESQEQDLEDFLRLGNETTPSNRGQVNRYHEIDQQVSAQMALDIQELKDFQSRLPKPCFKPREWKK